jgi:hypothetical protein
LELKSFAIRSRELLKATVIAATCTGFSFLAGKLGLGHDYYFAALLPVCMMGCIFVAWVLYLKADGISWSSRSDRPGTSEATASLDGAPPSAVEATQISAPDGSLHGLPRNALRDEDPALYAPWNGPLVQRSPRKSKGTDRPEPASPIRVLLWAALQLGLLATLLYSLAGLGARVFNS